MWLLALLGCIDLDPETEIGDVALDYLIDRTLVPAVRQTRYDAPLWEPRVVDALVLSPWRVSHVTASVCGVRDDIPVDIRDTSCFDNPELVDELGPVPATWDTSPLAQACGLGDCVLEVPILVEAEGGGEVGRGVLYAELDNDPSSNPKDAPPPPDLYIDGALLPDGGVVEERTLELYVEVEETKETWEAFRWYVTAGTLLGTGRTAVTERLSSEDVAVTENTLELPPDFSGQLVIAVVAAPFGDVKPSTWTTRTLEVP